MTKMKMKTMLKRKMMNSKLNRMIWRRRKKVPNKSKKSVKRRDREESTDTTSSGRSMERTLSWVSLRIQLTDKNWPNWQDGTHQEMWLLWLHLMSTMNVLRLVRIIFITLLVRIRTHWCNHLSLRVYWRRDMKYCYLRILLMSLHFSIWMNTTRRN